MAKIPLQISFETAIKLVLDKELRFRRSSGKAPGDTQLSFCNNSGMVSCDYGHYHYVSSNLSQLLHGAKMQKLATESGFDHCNVSYCDTFTFKLASALH